MMVRTRSVFFGSARIFRAELGLEIVVVDLPEQLLAVELEAAEVVLAVRVVVRIEVIERDHLRECLRHELGTLAVDAARQIHAAAAREVPSGTCR